MIGRIHGTLLAKHPPQLLIDVHGLGYEVDVPMSTFYQLPDTGSSVVLHTHFIVRDDGHFLYGFASEEERSAFRLLLKVSGIGARMALAVLSGLSVSELAQAIAAQESKPLTRVPGIGKKTAERLLLELRDKFTQQLATDRSAASSPAPGPGDERSDILNALLALGYKEREALLALKEVPADTSVSDGIRLALRRLSRAAG